MPFVYDIDGNPSTPYATHSTPNTEDPTVVMRQATRGFDLQAVFVHGRASQATSITGIGYRVRRATTAGSGGSSITPSPRRIGTTASTTAADKQTAITQGTGLSTQIAFGCGKAGPGGWVARDEDSMVHVEAGSSDELSINSLCGEASVPHHVSAEIRE